LGADGEAGSDLCGAAASSRDLMAKQIDAYELALGALSHKERTEAELAEWLRGRGVEEAELAEALTRLVEDGAIDDERFARRYAEDKRELRGWGPDRIADALRARGLDEGLIEAATGTEDAGEIAGRALEVLEQNGASVEDDASRAKALSLLARRGYPLETAYDAVRALERRSRAA
jgi:regulatory protein